MPEPVIVEPKRRRRWARIALRITAGLVLLVVLLVGLVHSSWGKEKIRSRIEAKLSARVVGQVSIASLDYGFLFSELELRGIEIRDVRGETVIAVEEVSFQLDRWSSIGGTISIDDARIEGVRVAVNVAQDGTNSLQSLFLKSDGQSSSISIRSLLVRDFEVDVKKAGGDEILISEGELRLRLDKAEETQVDLHSIGFQFFHKRGAGLSISGRFEQQGASIRKTADQVLIEVMPMTTSTTITRLGAPVEHTDIRLGKSSVMLSKGRIEALLDDVELGPVHVGKVVANLSMNSGNMHGRQEVRLEEIGVDTDTLSKLLNRAVPIGDAKGEILIQGTEDALTIGGNFEAKEGRIGISGTINLVDPAGPSYSIETTTDIDLDVRPLLPEQVSALARLFPSEITLTLQGVGLPSSGGTLDLALDASDLKDGKATDLMSVRAHIEDGSIVVDSMRVNVLGAVIEGGGRMTPSDTGSDRAVLGTLKITGNAKEVVAQLKEMGVHIPPRLRLPADVDLSVSLSGSLSDRLIVEIAPSMTEIAGGQVGVVGWAEFQRGQEGMELLSAEGKLSLKALTIAQIARLARKPTPKFRGTVQGEVHIRQVGKALTVRHEVKVRIPRYGVVLDTKGTVARSKWKGRVRVRDISDGTLLGWAQGEVPITRHMKLHKGGKMRLRGKLGHVRISDLEGHLPSELGEKLQASLSSGQIALAFDLAGSLSRPKGQVDIAAEFGFRKRPDALLKTDISIAVESSAKGKINLKPKGDIFLRGVSEPLLSLEGLVSVDSKGRQSMTERLSLDVELVLPRRSLGSVIAISGVGIQAQEYLSGDVSGRLHVRGTPKTPRVHAELEINDLPTTSGETKLSASMDASVNGGSFELSVGDASPFELRVKADVRGETWHVRGQTHADNIAILEQLPRFLAKSISAIGDVSARLSSDLGASATLHLASGTPVLESLTVDGQLEVSADAFPIPDSSRTIRNPKFTLKGDKDSLVANLSVEESDSQNAKRHASVEARVELADIRKGGIPKGTAHVKAEQWLLSGGVLGEHDAPRGVLDVELVAELDLSKAVADVDLRIESLRYSEPDRETFIHEFESFAPKGDIVFTDRSEIPVGKLGVMKMPTVKNDSSSTKALIHLHIPKPIEIAKGPLTLALVGDIEVPLGYGDGPSGAIEIVIGQISLLGKVFDLERSDIVLATVPTADLFFSHQLPPDVLRKVSGRSAGEKVLLHLRPIGGGPLLSLSGAGNQSLMQSFSLMHTGRPYVYGQPDLPASSVIRAPEKMQPMTLGFVHTYIPRLHLFDRFGSWSNPYDTFGAYGQMRYLDAEKRIGRASRFRLVAKPQQIGRSTSEARIDRLFMDTKSMSLGVGARLGTRIGGGVGVFFEWSSDN